MTIYHYVALEPDGKKKSGKIEAQNILHAKKLVSSTGNLLIDVRKTTERNWFSLERHSTPAPYDVATFASELSSLLDAGASLRKALDIQSEGHGASADLAKSIRTVVDNGGSLSEGLCAAGGPAILLAEFAKAGEAGAGIDRLLSTGSRFLKARHTSMAKLRSTLSYPLFIVVLAVIALGVITLYVAPALAPSLEDAGQTGFIIMLSKLGNWIKFHNREVLVCIAGIISLTYLFLKQKRVHSYFNRIVWALPILGSIAKDLDTGQSCEVLSALLNSGRPLESSLRFAAAVSGPQLAATYNSIAERLRDGQIASAAFAAEKELPLEVRRLALLGERSSAFAKAIEQAGQLCHERAIQRVDRLASVAGPILVIGLGIAITTLMLSVLGSLSSIGDIPL